MIKYILFDVSGTLLYKPKVYSNIKNVLYEIGFNVPKSEIIKAHKLVSELIFFPDCTDASFYTHFNSEFLRTLGIVPNDDLLKKIFESCTYLPWERYEDTEILQNISVPIGILSNFNSSLKYKIKHKFPNVEFEHIFVSEEFGLAKPNPKFFTEALLAIPHLKKEEILYIGDSIKLDIEPSENLGLRTLLIDRYNIYPLAKNKIQDLRKIPQLL